MKSIINVGLDVHSNNYTFCAIEPAFGGKDKVFETVKVEVGAKKCSEMHRQSSEESGRKL